MKTEQIILEIQTTGTISGTTISEIENNRELRLDLVQYFKENKNRLIALILLDLLCDHRKYSNPAVTGDTLMLACYILGLHGQIEDSLKIWNTKEIDFDTHCYIDIQLIVFGGVQNTIDFLEKQTTQHAADALEYVKGCFKSGDFNDIDKYYSDIPWFV